MRILCLHGMGTSSKCRLVILYTESDMSSYSLTPREAAIRGALAQSFSATFDFVEGALEWPAAPGINALAGPDAEYFAYYDTEKYDTIIQAVDDLEEYVKSEGPFDGVLAFSQGAALAAMLIARDNFPAPFAFAIFICGGPPFSEKSIKERNTLRYCENELDKEGKAVLGVPTVHLVGALDRDLETCMKLVHLSREETRQFWEHPAGHEIPTAPREVTDKMVETIERGIEKAMKAQ